MCAVCRSIPCHPSCPNSEPIIVCSCRVCRKDIQLHEEIFMSPIGEICEDCMEDMTAKEYVNIIGEPYTTAERS